MCTRKELFNPNPKLRNRVSPSPLLPSLWHIRDGEGKNLLSLFYDGVIMTLPYHQTGHSTDGV